MKSKLITAIRFLLFAGLAVGLLYWTVRDVDFEQTWAYFLDARYGWVLLSVLIGIFSHYIRALRWKMQIKPLGYNPKTYNTFFAVMIGYFANIAFPRLGEISKCGILRRYENIPMDKLLGTMILERGIDFLMLLLAFLITILLQFDLIWGFAYDNIIKGIGDKASYATNFLIISGVIGVAAIFLFFIFIDRIRHTRPYKTISNVVKGIIAGILTIRNVDNKPLYIFYTFLIWFCYFLMTWVVFYAMTDLTNLGPLAAAAVFVFGSLGMVAPTPGGIGAYHWMAINTLKDIYGVKEESATAFAFIIHTAQTMMIILLGFLSLILLPILNKNRNAKPTPTTDPTEDSILNQSA